MAAIFFEDLTKEKQAQLVTDEIEHTLQHGGYHTRSIYIEKDTYGYDEDPEKQTLEQHIHARVQNHRDREMIVTQWLLVWNCFDKEFNTVMQEDPEDESFKEQLALRAITVDYPPLAEMKDGMDAVILITVETIEKRFGVRIEVAAPKDISEEDKYALSRHFMGKIIFQTQFVDNKFKNGCAIKEAIHAIGEKMPEIVEAISNRKEYRYVVPPIQSKGIARDGLNAHIIDFEQ